jgi:hypothetical protein
LDKWIRGKRPAIAKAEREREREREREGKRREKKKLGEAIIIDDQRSVRHKKLTEGEGLRGPGLKERDGDVLTVEVEHGYTRLPLLFFFFFFFFFFF